MYYWWKCFSTDIFFILSIYLYSVFYSNVSLFWRDSSRHQLHMLVHLCFLVVTAHFLAVHDMPVYRTKKKALNFGKMCPHNNILLHCKLVLQFCCPICEHVLEWSLLFSVCQPVSKDLHHRCCCSTLSVWGKRGNGYILSLSLSPLSLSLTFGG